MCQSLLKPHPSYPADPILHCCTQRSLVLYSHRLASILLNGDVDEGASANRNNDSGQRNQNNGQCLKSHLGGRFALLYQDEGQQSIGNGSKA